MRYHLDTKIQEVLYKLPFWNSNEDRGITPSHSINDRFHLAWLTAKVTITIKEKWVMDSIKIQTISKCKAQMVSHLVASIPRGIKSHRTTIDKLGIEMRDVSQALNILTKFIFKIKVILRATWNIIMIRIEQVLVESRFSKARCSETNLIKMILWMNSRSNKRYTSTWTK